MHIFDTESFYYVMFYSRRSIKVSIGLLECHGLENYLHCVVSRRSRSRSFQFLVLRLLFRPQALDSAAKYRKVSVDEVDEAISRYEWDD